jgi:hypothetical protein
MRRATRLAAGLLLAWCFLLGQPLTASAEVPTPSPTTPPAASDDSGATTACPDRPPAQPDHAPVLAHFYIWFTASSWNRAKSDYPAVGRYSSDQASVMTRQVQQARGAGIDGFLVSWKSSDVLNARLATLRDVAAANDFKLGITYEAQDFNRDPLPVTQVRTDLEEFADRYADDPVFRVLGTKPVVAISGTWHYSEAELHEITDPVSSRLLLLATEKNVEGYQRVASAFQGDLYYWSSADPERTPGYAQKLIAMANAVRANCGVWVAPVAPGFDARQIGGTSVEDRRNGATLRSSWQAALSTVPDALGVISWNEYSESTYIEPSEQFGTRYLDVLRALTGAPPPPGGQVDSSDPQGSGSGLQGTLAASAVLGSVILVTALGTWRRRGHRAP